MHDWEIDAHLQIRNLVAGYAQCADSGRFEALVAMFTDDAVLDVPGLATHHGRAAIAAMFERAKEHLSGADPAAGASAAIRHHVSSHHIEIESPQRARSSCYYSAHMVGGVDHWGRYRDTFVALDGRWLFSHRRILRDGAIPGGWGSRGDEWVGR